MANPKAVAGRTVLLLCGDYMEDYEVANLFLSLSIFEFDFLPYSNNNNMDFDCRLWFLFKPCKPTESPLMLSVPGRKPAIFVALPFMSLLVIRSSLPVSSCLATTVYLFICHMIFSLCCQASPNHTHSSFNSSIPQSFINYFMFSNHIFLDIKVKYWIGLCHQTSVAY